MDKIVSWLEGVREDMDETLVERNFPGNILDCDGNWRLFLTFYLRSIGQVKVIADIWLIFTLPAVSPSAYVSTNINLSSTGY